MMPMQGNAAGPKIVRPQSMAIPYAGMLNQQANQHPNPVTNLNPSVQKADASTATAAAQQAQAANAQAKIASVADLEEAAQGWLDGSVRPDTSSGAYKAANTLAKGLTPAKPGSDRLNPGLTIGSNAPTSGKRASDAAHPHYQAKNRGFVTKSAKTTVLTKQAIDPRLLAGGVGAAVGMPLGYMAQSVAGGPMAPMSLGVLGGFGLSSTARSGWKGDQLGFQAGASGLGGLAGGAGLGALLSKLIGRGNKPQAAGGMMDAGHPSPEENAGDDMMYEKMVMASDLKSGFEKSAHPAVHKYLRDTLMHHGQTPDPVGAAYADWTYLNYMGDPKTATARKRYECLARLFAPTQAKTAAFNPRELGKLAAQDSSKPQRSATGESEGLTFAQRDDDYAQGQAAWEATSKYFKGGKGKKPNPFKGKHAGDMTDRAAALAAVLAPLLGATGVGTLAGGRGVKNRLRGGMTGFGAGLGATGGIAAGSALAGGLPRTNRDFAPWMLASLGGGAAGGLLGGIGGQAAGNMLVGSGNEEDKAASAVEAFHYNLATALGQPKAANAASKRLAALKQRRDPDGLEDKKATSTGRYMTTSEVKAMADKQASEHHHTRTEYGCGCVQSCRCSVPKTTVKTAELCYDCKEKQEKQASRKGLLSKALRHMLGTNAKNLPPVATMRPSAKLPSAMLDQALKARPTLSAAATLKDVPAFTQNRLALQYLRDNPRKMLRGLGEVSTGDDALVRQATKYLHKRVPAASTAVTNAKGKINNTVAPVPGVPTSTVGPRSADPVARHGRIESYLGPTYSHGLPLPNITAKLNNVPSIPTPPVSRFEQMTEASLGAFKPLGTARKRVAPVAAKQASISDQTRIWGLECFGVDLVTKQSQWPGGVVRYPSGKPIPPRARTYAELGKLAADLKIEAQRQGWFPAGNAQGGGSQFDFSGAMGQMQKGMTSAPPISQAGGTKGLGTGGSSNTIGVDTTGK